MRRSKIKTVSDLKPFEICSIRPPTENFSLTFRLTRNCGWNKCFFCPVYKYGAKFSRRTIEEVKTDIIRAKEIDDFVMEHIIYTGVTTVTDGYKEIEILTKNIKEEENFNKSENHEDERIKWFSVWFKDKPTLKDSLEHIYSWRMGGAQTCFFGDANTLLVKPDFFSEVMENVRKYFPTLKRFTIYGRTKSAAKMELKDLKAFKDAGLNRIHFGIESGSDKVLSFMKKGETAKDHIEGCLKTRETGISPSVYIMPGLGGATLSEEHAYETAKVLSMSKPDYIRIRTLEVFSKTPLMNKIDSGEFIEADEEQIVKEIRIIIENTDTETNIVSDSATNLLDINGRLPEDRKRMLFQIDAYLNLPERAKLEFSVSSRINSFVGQYGGITEDIYRLLIPFLNKDGLDFSKASDKDLKNITKYIRSRLMP